MTSSLDLTNKVAIVTGASKGIGKATALRLACGGAKVVIHYATDDQSAQAVVEDIGSDKALAVKGNAASAADMGSLVQQTVDRFGKIDILIPNAGSLPYKDLGSTTEQDYDDCFDLNVKGVYFLIQKTVPFMGAGSRIILVSSTLCHASTVNPRYLLYLATKGAVEQMVRVLCKDLASKEITVNAVSPGPTDTPLFNKGMSEPALNFVKNLIPSGRLGKPEEIAEVMAFFASEASAWVSGQVLRVNGGMA